MIESYVIGEDTISDIRKYMINFGVPENHRDYILGRLRAEEYTRARAPVVAQQAPAMAVGESRFACPFQTGCEDGEGFCEYPCEKWLDWHFVSREKAIEFMMIKDREIKQKIAQAREDVLKQIIGFRTGLSSRCLSQGKQWDAETNYLESLRSEVGK